MAQKNRGKKNRCCSDKQHLREEFINESHVLCGNLCILVCLARVSYGGVCLPFHLHGLSGLWDVSRLGPAGVLCTLRCGVSVRLGGHTDQPPFPNPFPHTGPTRPNGTQCYKVSRWGHWVGHMQVNTHSVLLYFLFSVSSTTQAKDKKSDYPGSARCLLH